MERVNTNAAGADTHSLSGNEPENINSATSNLITPVTYEEVEKHIKAATDPLTKQSDRLRDL